MNKETQKIIGIDLGTTNSCVSIIEGNEPKVIPNSEGNRTTPSVVTYRSDNRVDVGVIAKRQAVTYPKNTIQAVKRLIGRKFNDSEVQQHIIPHVGYKVIEADNGDAWIQVDDNKLAPQQVSSEILRKMKEAAENYLGAKVKKAVITVPAYFNDAQRQATKDAGKIAGLEVERIVNEPTAAALAYGSNNKKTNSKIAVYDLGGGTFDISIIEVIHVEGDNQIQVLSTNGDTSLGGEDFDNLIIKHAIDTFHKNTGVNLNTDMLALQRIKEAAEKAKIELSSSASTRINLPYITVNENGPQHLEVEITQNRFNSMISNLVDRTIEPCRKAIKDAQLDVSDIDDVLLVGGQTRTPLVKEKVGEFFGKDKIRQNLNADEAVSLGAAIQGGIIAGDITDVLLLDVTPLSLGIETYGDVFTRIIPRNTTIPTKKSQIFSTAADNQTSVSIKVCQGERDRASDNKVLGMFNLDDIRPARRGVPQIEVEFDISADGILKITAQDKDTKRSQHISVQGHGGLSEEEIKQMEEDARRNADKDAEFKELVALRNQSDNLIYVVEKFINDYAKQIPEDKITSLQSALEELKKVQNSEDKDQIKQQVKSLEEAFAPIRDMNLKAEPKSEDTGSNTSEEAEVVNEEKS